jgi:hypothetical protein
VLLSFHAIQHDLDEFAGLLLLDGSGSRAGAAPLREERRSANGLETRG